MQTSTGAAVSAADLQGIARRFGRRWVLRGVSLRVEPGEAVALMGRNGSGKTTLLRIVSTALSPTRGTGRVFGHDLQRAGERVRGLVGVLGHAAGLYEDLTGAENLQFALRMCGMKPDRSAIEGALAEVGLVEAGDERVRTFSAGMRRRLALARLVLRPPRLLLLDEPYAAFDVDGIRKVNDFVRRVTAAGGAAIVSTHDLERALPVADRVVHIVDGQLYDGAPSDLDLRLERAEGDDAEELRSAAGGAR